MSAAPGEDRPGVGWVRVRTADGSWTVLEPGSGRALHDLAGARSEARARFARAAGLHRVGSGTAVRLLDVGTGLGLNLAAAVECARRRGFRLQAVGLEARPALCELARRLPPDPDPGFEAARRAALAGLLEGSTPLLAGDAHERLADAGAEPFDVVFLDGFAPADGGRLWSDAFQRALVDRLAPGGAIVTYTASARLRALWLALGLEVGAGPRCGRKAGGSWARRPAHGAEAGPGPAPVDGPPLPPAQRAKLERRARRLAAGAAPSAPPTHGPDGARGPGGQ